MRQSAFPAVVAAVVFISACATVSQMQATSGSRADGIVKLSFEYGMFDRVQIDTARALETARKRCGTWGYSGAEPFGGITRQCQASSGYGCMRWFATVEYQCTSASAQPAVAAAPYSAPIPNSGPSPSGLVASNSAVSGDPPGTIDTGRVKLIPAKTLSGYCIKAPYGYIGTGSVSSPAITAAKPLCSQ